MLRRHVRDKGGGGVCSQGYSQEGPGGEGVGQRGGRSQAAISCQEQQVRQEAGDVHGGLRGEQWQKAGDVNGGLRGGGVIMQFTQPIINCSHSFLQRMPPSQPPITPHTPGHPSCSTPQQPALPWLTYRARLVPQDARLLLVGGEQLLQDTRHFVGVCPHQADQQGQALRAGHAQTGPHLQGIQDPFSNFALFTEDTQLRA